MIVRRAQPLAVLIIAGTAGQLFAQSWRVDFSGSTVRYDTGSRFGSAAVSPHMGWVNGRSAFSLGGSLATLGRSEWSVQGKGAAATTIGLPGTIDALLSGDLGGTVHSSRYRTGLLRGDARLQQDRERGGWWAGLTAASGWTSIAGAGSASAWGLTGGGWVQLSDGRFGVSVAPFRLAGSWFTDLQGEITLRAGRSELSAYAGWRGASATTQLRDEPWGGASLIFQATSRVSLLAGAGWYAADLLQGLPRGRYASFGVRVSTSRPLVVLRPLPQFYRKRGNMGELAFIVSDASQVELAAEWNHWERVPLRLVGRRWVLDVTLTPGVYRFNLVLDGDRWIVPEGVTEVDDGFGGKTGLLIVPE